MSFHLFPALVALAFLSVASSQGCGATNKVHNNALKTPYKPMNSAICNMFDASCCTVNTELTMKQSAGEFSNVLFLQAKSISLGDALPDLPEPFVDLVMQGNVVSYEEITRTALAFFVKDTCSVDNDLVRVTSTYVKSVADKYYAMSMASQAISDHLGSLQEYDLSEECQIALIKNGIPTNRMLRNEYCQVCQKSTIKSRTCKSLCINTINACMNELTGVSEILNDLVIDMDVLYVNLWTEINAVDGALAMFEATIRSVYLDANPQCDTGDKLDSDDAMVDKTFFSVTKRLGNFFKNAIKFPCALSNAQQANCWTGDGMATSYTESDYPIYEFTTVDQLMNPVIARTTPGESVIVIENALSDARNIVLDALEEIDLFIAMPTEAVIETEAEKEEEKEVEVVKEEDKTPVEEVEKEVEMEKEGDMEKEPEKEEMEKDNESEKEEEKDTGMSGDQKDIEEEKDGGYVVDKEEDNTSEGDKGMEGDKNKVAEVSKEDEPLDTNAKEGASTDSSAVSSSVSILFSLSSLLLCLM